MNNLNLYNKVIRKRFRTRSWEAEENKRPKTLIDGDIEDFIDYLEEKTDLSPEKHHVAKEQNMAASTSQCKNDQQSGLDLNILKDPAAQKELFTLFGPLFKEIESNVCTNLMTELRSELGKKDNKIAELEAKIDRLEQSQRQDSLKFYGLKESENEDTDKLIIKTLKENLNIDLTPMDISNSHRIGKIGNDNKSNKQEDRPILVKLTRESVRDKLLNTKKELREKESTLYINESLTKKTADLFKKARDIKKQGYIKMTWTRNGKIYYKENENDPPMEICSEDQINTIKEASKQTTSRE